MYLTIRRGNHPAAHASVWNENGAVRIADEFGRVEPYDSWKKPGTRIHIQPDGPNGEVFDRQIEYDSDGQLLPLELPSKPKVSPEHPQGHRGLLPSLRKWLDEYWRHLIIFVLFVVGVAAGTFIYLYFKS